MAGPYFHVDRFGQLKSGDVLDLFDLSTLPAMAEPEWQKHVQTLFPQGLTKHGLTWFYWQNDDALMYPPHGVAATAIQLEQMRSASIEIVVEYVRQAHFDSLPSRWQSVFAYPNRADAEAFRAKLKQRFPNVQIVEVSGTEAFRGDVGFLSVWTTVATSWCAHKYWSGAAHPAKAPEWEVLLKPPVKVV